MIQPSLEQAIAAVQQLPNLPSTTRVVLGYLSDEDAEVNQVVRAIAQDQGLVARVLRIANSTFYGLSGQVQTLQEAVVVLGFSNLRLIVTAAMITAQKFPGLAGNADVQILFRHSLSVAICASILGRNNKLNANLLFLAGLLHDIGKLALMTIYPAQYVQVQELRSTNDRLTTEAEEQVFGFNHATIGAALCRHWHIPEVIAVAIGGHHSAGDAQDVAPSTADAGLFSELIHLADAIAHGLDLEADTLATVPPISESVWNRFAGKREQLLADFAEIRAMYLELVVLVENRG